MSEAVGKRRWSWWRDLAIFVVVVVAIQLWHKRDVVSGPAPALAGALAGGGAGSLDAFRQAQPGRPVALYFWAEWCPICKAVEGSVDAVGRDWPLLTVAMQSGDAAAVAARLAARGLTWTTLVDADGALTATYGLHGVPALVVIDGDGRIRFIELGYTSEWGMRLRLWWAGNFRRRRRAAPNRGRPDIPRGNPDTGGPRLRAMMAAHRRPGRSQTHRSACFSARNSSKT